MLLKRVMHLSTETSLLLLSPASLMVAIVYACLLSPSDKGCATWNGAGARGHQAHVKESFHSSAASPLLQSPADDDHLPGSPTHADGGRAPADSVSQVLLSRMGILRALLVPYMVPLMVVYFFEYSINQAMFLPLGFAISRQGSHQVQDACGTYSYLQLLYQVGSCTLLAA